MVERQMMRGAIPVLLLAFGAIAGCTCNGNVSPLTDGGNVVADAGTDSGPPPVNDCAYYYCPPISSDGGLVVITFGNPDGGDGGMGFSLDGGQTGSYGNGVTVNPNGQVTLSSTDIQLNFALIANWTRGTVSKFDTK